MLNVYAGVKQALEASTTYELISSVFSSSDFAFDVASAYEMRNGVPAPCTQPLARSPSPLSNSHAACVESFGTQRGVELVPSCTKVAKRSRASR